jgi:hypothetical protein
MQGRKKKNEKQATKEKEKRANKSTKVHLKEIEDLPEETDSDEEYEEDENSVQNQGQNINDNLEVQVNQIIEVNKWVLVAYATKKTVKHFVGQILKANGDEFEVKFLKLFNAVKSQYTFIWPIFTDSDVVDYDDIVKVLPEPKIPALVFREFFGEF